MARARFESSRLCQGSILLKHLVHDWLFQVAILSILEDIGAVAAHGGCPLLGLGHDCGLSGTASTHTQQDLG